MTSNGPDKAPVTMKAITWNMGNQEASSEAVDAILAQFDGSTPTIIALSTQEEFASGDDRLQIKLWNKLNEGLDEKDKYDFVITDDPQFHTTFAGANNSIKTFAGAIFTDKNRVSSVVLVKRPYKLDKAEARIDFEPDKGKDKDSNKKKNKSIITIKGTLVGPEGSLMDVSISGGHLNAKSDAGRRKHANKFFKKEGLLGSDKSFAEIYKEASTFRLIMGDFNERDYLKKDGTTQDGSDETNLARLGYDMAENPTITMKEEGGEPIDLKGSYGHVAKDKDDLSKGMTTNVADPKRENVAKGGYLDKVGCNTGLDVKAEYSKKPFNLKAFIKKEKSSKKENQDSSKPPKVKWFFHKSDHIPVIRSFTVAPVPYDDLEKIKIAARYIERRLPIKEVAKEIELLKKLADSNPNELMHNVDGMMYHDSKQTSSEFIRQYAGISKDQWNKTNDHYNLIIKALGEKLKQKEAYKSNLDAIQQKISKVGKIPGERAQDESTLATSYNLLTKCQNLKNLAQELRGEKEDKFPGKDKYAIVAMAQRYCDQLIENAVAKHNGKNPPHDTSELDFAFNGLKDQKVFKKFAQAVDDVKTFGQRESLKDSKEDVIKGPPPQHRPQPMISKFKDFAKSAQNELFNRKRAFEETVKNSGEPKKPRL